MLKMGGAGLSLEAQVAVQIEAEKEAVFTSVYLQLEEQNALPLYDNYVQLLTPRIESAVYDAYNFGPCGMVCACPLGIDAIMTNLPTEQLEKYDDYSCVTDMYDPVENYKASVVTAWIKHPYVEWDTSLIHGDVAFIEFEK